MNSKARPIGFAAIGLTALVALAGCSGAGAPGASGGNTPDTLIIAINSQPSSFDPTKAANGTQIFYQEFAYDPLIDVDQDGNFIPALATKWEYVEGSNGTKFELTLRSGVKFADGEDLTPDAVANSINYFATQGTGPAAGSMKTLHATADGADSVLITSTVPDPVIPDLLSPANLGGNIIAPKGLADPTQLANATFGAGPYVLDATQSVAGDHYVYTPNPNYYDTSRQHFSTVQIKVIKDATSSLQALKTGQIDVMSGDNTIVDAASNNPAIAIEHQSSFWDGMFIADLNGDVVPALANQQVRQALNYAVDRDSIVKAVYGDYAQANDQPNTPGWDAYDPTLAGTYTYDPDKAKQLLAAAGYPNGFTFTDTYAAFEPQTTQLVQALADQFSKVGVTMKLEGAQTIGDLVTNITSKKYSAFSLKWGGQSQFANVKQLWLQGGAENPFNVSVPGLDDAFAAYSASNTQTRTATANAVQKILVDQAATVPVIQGDNIWFIDPALTGFQLNKLGKPTNPVTWTFSN